MKKVKYHLTNGKTKEFEYDEKAPCWICGLPVVSASMGGTVICPWCDCGKNRDGSPKTPEQEREGKRRFRKFRFHPDLNLGILKIKKKPI